MTPDWRASITRPAPAAAIADIARYVAVSGGGNVSAVDAFYAATTDILRAADPAFLTDHPALGPLLLVGIVSATENYFRDIFAAVLSLCPVAQEAASAQSVQLGTVMWHGGHIPERGAFEHLSFAAADNIKNSCRKFLGHEIEKRGPTDAALQEFDRVCELRHGIVHAGGVLAGKNALKLQLKPTKPLGRCVTGFAELQECAAVCTTLVVAANRELFGALAERWALDWRKHRTWVQAEQHRRFRAIWDAFHSTIDAGAGLISGSVGVVKCRNLVKKQFRVT